jgi:integrase
MPRASLSAQFVKNIQVTPKHDKHKQESYFDNLKRGVTLVLVVSCGQPKDHPKTWRVLTYVNGKAKSHKLGIYPQMTVAEASEKALEFWKDPKKFLAKTETGSFKDVAEQWVRRYVEKKKLRSKQEIERILQRYVYPKWKDHPFRDIRRLEVNALLDRIEDNHGMAQADAVLAVVRGVCNWYQTRADDYDSPIVKGMKRDKRKPEDKRRDRFLDDNEIRLVWKACDEMGTFGALAKVLLLTASRREKVATMKRSDVVEDGVWTIASEDREKGTADKIKLPQMALDIIAAQPHIAGNPYVFAARGKGPFNSWSQRKEELDQKLPPNMPRWTLHDLRRTARKLMTRAHIRTDVAELALGHSIKGIQATYDDPSEYQSMIDDAFQCVANEVEKILNPPPPRDNVVDMAAGRRRAPG